MLQLKRSKILTDNCKQLKQFILHGYSQKLLSLQSAWDFLPVWQYSSPNLSALKKLELYSYSISGLPPALNLEEMYIEDTFASYADIDWVRNGINKQTQLRVLTLKMVCDKSIKVWHYTSESSKPLKYLGENNSLPNLTELNLLYFPH